MNVVGFIFFFIGSLIIQEYIDLLLYIGLIMMVAAYLYVNAYIDIQRHESQMLELKEQYDSMSELLEKFNKRESESKSDDSEERN